MLLSVCFAAILLGLATPVHAQYEPPWANDQSRGEDLDIELLTFGVGDDIPSWFGHTALAVRDRRLGVARLYNYGMFSFGPDMVPKFMRGRLEFWVGQASYARTIAFYVDQNRDVTVQLLNLSPERRLEVAEYLAWNVRPENRDYLYDHFSDNCSTRIRDVIDRAIGGQFAKVLAAPARMTLRDHVHRYTERNLYIDQILTFWMNGKIDQPIHQWEEMFLPAELQLRVGMMKYVNDAGEIVPLVAETRILNKAKNRDPVPESPATLVPWLFLFGAAWGGFAFGLARWLAHRRESGVSERLPRAVFGLWNVCGGLFFGIAGLISPLYDLTDHVIAQWNPNIFLSSPLTFMAAPLGIGLVFGSRRCERWLAWCWKAMVFASAIGIVIALFVTQVMRQPIALLLPVNVGYALAFWRLHRPKT